MNKEIILERIKQIEQEMQSVKAQYARLEGHLEESKYWLANSNEDCIKEEKKENEENPDGV